MKIFNAHRSIFLCVYLGRERVSSSGEQFGHFGDAVLPPFGSAPSYLVAAVSHPHCISILVLLLMVLLA